MQHDHSEQAQHGGTKATYNMVFVALVILTIIEIFFAEIAGLANIIMMVAVVIKFALVAAYYMHLKYEPPILTWLFVVPVMMGVAVVLSLQALAGY